MFADELLRPLACELCSFKTPAHAPTNKVGLHFKSDDPHSLFASVFSRFLEQGPDLDVTRTFTLLQRLFQPIPQRIGIPTFAQDVTTSHGTQQTDLVLELTAISASPLVTAHYVGTISHRPGGRVIDNITTTFHFTRR